jgi:hypothetical protein
MSISVTPWVCGFLWIEDYATTQSASTCIENIFNGLHVCDVAQLQAKKSPALGRALVGLEGQATS